MLTSEWRSPSNIALIKYWGKYGDQLPQNPSLSFTLDACTTTMRIQVITDAPSPALQVLYDGSPKPSFVPKIQKLLTRIGDEFPWIAKADITIDSVNSFPHGAGIASSASAMSALALCVLDIDAQWKHQQTDQISIDLTAASRIARLGSGSACRSVFPVAALWGDDTVGSSQNAIPWQSEIHEMYQSYRDTILIVSPSEKSVSSTQGHALMDALPYANTRYDVARKNLHQLIEVMRRHDRIDAFIEIVESEAMQLHALMMSGIKPFILMEPNTIAIIRKVWAFRKETGLPVCFTLDAGPNVHLLYPDDIRDQISIWIQNELLPYCHERRCIDDKTGSGPVKLS